MNKFNLSVSSLYAGQRLDVFLSLTTDLTRSHIKKLVEEDCCLVNGKLAKVKYIVKEKKSQAKSEKSSEKIRRFLLDFS